jgi:hypothetical protein
MTFKEKMLGLLKQHGLSDGEAETVLALAQADPANAAMKGRWEDNVEGYPAEMFTLLWLTVKHTARDYLAEYNPEAWYRPLFEEESEAAA